MLSGITNIKDIRGMIAFSQNKPLIKDILTQLVEEVEYIAQDTSWGAALWGVDCERILGGIAECRIKVEGQWVASQNHYKTLTFQVGCPNGFPMMDETVKLSKIEVPDIQDEIDSFVGVVMESFALGAEQIINNDSWMAYVQPRVDEYRKTGENLPFSMADVDTIYIDSLIDRDYIVHLEGDMYILHDSLL